MQYGANPDSPMPEQVISTEDSGYLKAHFSNFPGQASKTLMIQAVDQSRVTTNQMAPAAATTAPIMSAGVAPAAATSKRASLGFFGL